MEYSFELNKSCKGKINLRGKQKRLEGSKQGGCEMDGLGARGQNVRGDVVGEAEGWQGRTGIKICK